MNRLSILEVLREVWQLADTRDLTMSVHVGDRNPESRGMRYIVKRAGEPLCCVKRLPISGPFDLQSLLATQKAYQSLQVVKAPQVLGWTQDDQSFFVVEQFVKDGIRLDEAEHRGVISWPDARDLVVKMFEEIYSRPIGPADAKVDVKRITAAVEESSLNIRQKRSLCRRFLDSLPPMWHAPVWTNRDFLPQNFLLSEGRIFLVDFDLSCKTGLLGMDVMRVELYTGLSIPFWPADGARRDDPLTELLFLLLEQNLQFTIARSENYQRWLERHGARVAELSDRVLGSAAETVPTQVTDRQNRPAAAANGDRNERVGISSARLGIAENVQGIAWNLKQRLKQNVSRFGRLRPGLGALFRDAREGMFGRASEWESAGDSGCTFWVESSGQWTFPEKSAVISGWCYSKDGQIEGIRAVVNGKVYDGYYGGERPDVQAKLHNELRSMKVGFSVQCPVRWGYNDVALEARRGERWIPVCRSIRRAAYFPLVVPEPPASYENHLAAQRQDLEDHWGDYVEKGAAFALRPLISIAMPVYRTDPVLLSKAIESVRRQIYDYWELCIVDDASQSEEVDRVLRGLANDSRIKIKVRSERGNISAATNDAIALAGGEWIAFLDHDDELAPDALYHIVQRINLKPECDLIYTDQDKIDTTQKRWEPFFKPDWSPEYFRGAMYLGHLTVVRTSLVREIGGSDARFDGVQDYEMELRLSERTSRIEHIPRVLYHWRATAGSVAANGNAKTGIDELQEQAVQEHLDRLGIAAKAQRGRGHRVRLIPSKRDIYPKISILIPTRDHPELIGRCLKTLFEVTAYPNFEVLVGDNETRDPEALKILGSYPVKRIPLVGGFHFARFNNILGSQATGEYLMLLNNDTEIVQSDWLDHLLLYTQQEDVGAAGALLTYADGTVQHAGIILGPRGTADHTMRGFPADCDGYMGSLVCTREVTAVTAAALMISRRKFQLLGGLSERFQRHYDDLDFCLRLRKAGFRNLSVATSRLVHHESRSRGDKYDFTDRMLLLDRWEPLIDQGDDFYNVNFDPGSTDYRVGSGGLAR